MLAPDLGRMMPNLPLLGSFPAADNPIVYGRLTSDNGQRRSYIVARNSAELFGYEIVLNPPSDVSVHELHATSSSQIRPEVSFDDLVIEAWIESLHPDSLMEIGSWYPLRLRISLKQEGLFSPPSHQSSASVCFVLSSKSFVVARHQLPAVLFNSGESEQAGVCITPIRAGKARLKVAAKSQGRIFSISEFLFSTVESPSGGWQTYSMPLEGHLLSTTGEAFQIDCSFPPMRLDQALRKDLKILTRSESSPK